MNKLKMTDALYQELRNWHMETKEERLSFLFGHTYKVGNKRLTVIPPQTPILIGDDCFTRQTGTNVVLDKQVQASIYYQFINNQEGYNTLINIHDHWFDKEGTIFSGVDDRDDLAQSLYFEKTLLPEWKQLGKKGQIYSLSLVLDQNSMSARFTRASTKQKFFGIDQVQLLGRHYKTMIPNNAVSSKCSDGPGEIWSRHQGFVSKDSQIQLGNQHIGLVGTGGLGSILAEGLARLGVGELTLVDDDVLEMSNLNRFQSGGIADLGKPKVEVLKSHLETMFPSLKVNAIEAEFTSGAADRALSVTDILVAGFDSAFPRYRLNRFATAYLIPYFDLGVVVTNEDQVDFKERLIVTLPGVTSCMECSQFEILDMEEVHQALEDQSQIELFRRRGYFQAKDELPTPSVYPLNMSASSLLLTELLNYFSAYRPMATVISRSYQSQEERCDESNFPEVSHPNCPSCGDLNLGHCSEAHIPLKRDRHSSEATGDLLQKLRKKLQSNKTVA